MATTQIADRAVQTALNLEPAERDRLMEALTALSQDPFSPTLSTHVIAGAANMFVLRVSDRLRLIYRIERQQPVSLLPRPESIKIIVEDIVSKESLRRYLPGGDE